MITIKAGWQSLQEQKMNISRSQVSTAISFCHRK